MIPKKTPEHLIPLLTRLENPPADDKSFEAQLLKEITPTAIKLIKEGIGKGLIRKFKQGGENNQELLEQFILRAAMMIGTPTKAEREIEKREFLKEKIDGFIKELGDLDNAARTYLAGPIPFPFKPSGDIPSGRLVPIKERRIDCNEQREQARQALYKWMKKHLKQSPAHENPDEKDRLIRLFQELLPEENESFIDKQINRMLKPFGKDLKERSIEARIRRYYQ
jgi:hypothetical protein